MQGRGVTMQSWKGEWQMVTGKERLRGAEGEAEKGWKWYERIGGIGLGWREA